MPTSLVKTLIIGALLALLSGCSALRLAYNNGALAAWWWLDGYIDFPSDQTPRAKAAIDQLFDRTRGADLPQLAALLAAAQAEVLDPTTPAQVCRWQRQFRDRLDPIVDRGVLLAADLVGGLGEPQWRHLERQFEKKNADMRDDFLQPDPTERLARSVERTVERAEMLYGRLGDAQKRLIAAGVAASPFDPQAWIAERERRQRDTLQTLRRLTAERADRDRTIAALRTLAERTEVSQDPAYRTYQQRLAEYNCAFGAQLHNATTPAQRQAARAQLKTWEDDLRALAAPPQ